MTIKVICTTEDPYYNDVLTTGKIYDAYYDDTEPVYSSTGYYYVIVNDLGLKAQYYSGYFTTLEKWRDSKIAQIL